MNRKLLQGPSPTRMIRPGGRETIAVYAQPLGDGERTQLYQRPETREVQDLIDQKLRSEEACIVDIEGSDGTRDFRAFHHTADRTGLPVCTAHVTSNQTRADMSIHKYLFRAGIIKTSHRTLLSFPGHTGCDVQCRNTAVPLYRIAAHLPSEPGAHDVLCGCSCGGNSE